MGTLMTAEELEKIPVYCEREAGSGSSRESRQLVESLLTIEIKVKAEANGIIQQINAIMEVV